MSGAGEGRYGDSGVSHVAKDASLSGMVSHLKATLGFNPRARVRAGVGAYATVVVLESPRLGLAVGTDSVGTKVLVAQRAGRHDTIGIDCVAMNANDVACVGAEPLTLVDYVAVDVADAAVLEQVGRGLAEGARRAEISIAGGEIAQVRDLVKGEGEGCHYDLVGTCVGVVDPDAVIDGSGVEPGDAVMGIASTGVHSNGFSLLRRVLFETLGKRVGDRLPECGRSVAEELLEPTAIYVREIKALLAAGVPVRSLAHVTGGGFSNLLRVAATGVGFRLDGLPEPPPIFQLVQAAGGVSAAEMHQVFNLGVGLAVSVPEAHAVTVTAAAAAEGKRAWRIGTVVADPHSRVVVVRPGLEGALTCGIAKGAFQHERRVPPEHAR